MRHRKQEDGNQQQNRYRSAHGHPLHKFPFCAHIHVYSRGRAPDQGEEDAEGQADRPGKPLPLDFTGEAGEQERKEGGKQARHQPYGDSPINLRLSANVGPKEARPVFYLPLPAREQARRIRDDL